MKEGIHPIVGMPVTTDGTAEVALSNVSLFPLRTARIQIMQYSAPMPRAILFATTVKFLSVVGCPFTKGLKLCVVAVVFVVVVAVVWSWWWSW